MISSLDTVVEVDELLVTGGLEGIGLGEVSPESVLVG
jgi:hypothetical protein